MKGELQFTQQHFERQIFTFLSLTTLTFSQEDSASIIRMKGDSSNVPKTEIQRTLAGAMIRIEGHEDRQEAEFVAPGGDFLVRRLVPLGTLGLTQQI